MNTTQTLTVEGMHCASCALTIEKTLKKINGVISSEVNYGTEKVKVEYDPQTTNIDEFNKRIIPLGYSIRNQKIEEINRTENSSSSKEKDLNSQKNKLYLAVPAAIFMFGAMMWEIASNHFAVVPKFIIPMNLYNAISFILATIVLFWIGQPFVRGFIGFIRYRVANMDTLIGIGTLTAYIYSSILLFLPQVTKLLDLDTHLYFDVTIVVIGFISLGKYLESRSKLKTNEAIQKLLSLQAKTAIIDRNGEEYEIPIDQLKVDDIVIVKPGGKIVVDGVIVEGQSTVDESMITGEPIPVDKVIGNEVIGGTINKQGSFKFKATKVGAETLLSHIIKMVEEAQGSKAPIQKLADQISAIFVPTVLIIAITTFFAWIIIGAQFMPVNDAISYGLICFVSVLVIACPCALGLATPTAIIVGTGKGAENGILIKNADSLEKLYKVNTIVTDKTGTITKGKPAVIDILLLQKEKVKSAIEVLSITASLEKKSEHPIASAIVAKAKEENIKYLKVENFSNLEGKGIEGIINYDGSGEKTFYVGNTKLINDLGIQFDRKNLDTLTSQSKTPVILADDKEVLAIIAIADTIKENAKATVHELHKLGIKIVMLTGDNRLTAEYIAKQVGIDKVVSEVLPQDKAAIIKELQSKNIVAMVGDGINDAPALSQADVGIAMGTGTDIAIESAQITLLKGDFSKVLRAIRLSKFTIRAIKQNLFWAFVFNIIGIPLAAGVFYPIFGILLNPAFAGLAMAFSSVTVVSNSLRLRATKL